MTNAKFKITLAATALLTLTACMQGPIGQAYWQRVEDDSALWMTGPKAQQQLEQDISQCVHEVDELVRLDALRETNPPSTHSEYRRALDASGDLTYWDSPTRMGEHMVSHSDYHDFESCMRFKGWERVNYVRYQTAAQSQHVYQSTQEIRKYGVSGHAYEKKVQEKHETSVAAYKGLNQ